MPSEFELFPILSAAHFSTTAFEVSTVSNEIISISSRSGPGSDRRGAIDVDFLILVGGSIVEGICVEGLEDLWTSEAIC
jgi:hypothetical protein